MTRWSNSHLTQKTRVVTHADCVSLIVLAVAHYKRIGNLKAILNILGAEDVIEHDAQTTEEEFDVVTDSDKVVVDGLMHVLHRETPVIALMIKKGLIKEKDVIELSRIVAGEVPGRTAPVERIFFSPIGMAIVDVCLSFRVYNIAKQKGLGKKLGLFGGPL